MSTPTSPSPIERFRHAHAQFTTFHDTLTAAAPALRQTFRTLPLPMARGLLDQLTTIESHLPHLRLSLELLARLLTHLPAFTQTPVASPASPSAPSEEQTSITS
jgi:hypothetical protein